jgi:lipoate-protein ligase B
LTLEERIAEFVDLGTVNYSELLEIQRRQNESIVQKNSADKIFTAQVNPLIEFGANMNRNKFSEEILYELTAKYGTLFDENGKLKESIIEILKQDGIRGVPFSYNIRGGGATAFSPGQDRFHINGKLIDTLRNIMQDVVAKFIDPKKITLASLGKSESTQSESFDIAIKQPDKLYKLGSKGVKLYDLNGKTVMSGGFSLHHSENSCDYFHFVQPCGIPLQEVGVSYLQRHSPTRIHKETLHSVVIESVKNRLGYSQIKYQS